MRRYDDPVEVRRGADEGPEQFLWRGRLWQVREVVAHWVDNRPWFVPASACSCTVDPTAETDVWRVTAARGRAAAAVPEQAARGGDPGYGVFDLAFEWSSGDWRLAGAVD